MNDTNTYPRMTLTDLGSRGAWPVIKIKRRRNEQDILLSGNRVQQGFKLSRSEDETALLLTSYNPFISTIVDFELISP